MRQGFEEGRGGLLKWEPAPHDSSSAGENGGGPRRLNHNNDNLMDSTSNLLEDMIGEHVVSFESVAREGWSEGCTLVTVDLAQGIEFGYEVLLCDSIEEGNGVVGWSLLCDGKKHIFDPNGAALETETLPFSFDA